MMDRKYYSNLLIGQYHDRVKARNTVEIFVDNRCQIAALLNQMVDAFNPHTAVGKQLEIVGKYVGQSRSFNVIIDRVVFAFGDNDGGLQDNGTGFSNNEGGWQNGLFLTAYDLDRANYEADDSLYRFFLKLKIASNNGTKSIKNIGDMIFDIFGGRVVFFNNTNMNIGYLITNSLDPNVRKILENDKYLLPAPAGVDINFIVDIEGEKIFSFADDNGNLPYFGAGLSGNDEWSTGVFLDDDNFI